MPKIKIKKKKIGTKSPYQQLDILKMAEIKGTVDVDHIRRNEIFKSHHSYNRMYNNQQAQNQIQSTNLRLVMRINEIQARKDEHFGQRNRGVRSQADYSSQVESDPYMV